MNPTVFLAGLAKTARAYDEVIRRSANKFRLTPIEIKILSFLKNNPGKDTASDIIALRGLKKGNVSAAIDDLATRGLIVRRVDEKDRRVARLRLTDKARPIVDAVLSANVAFMRRVLNGFSDDDIRVMDAHLLKIFANAEKRGDQ